MSKTGGKRALLLIMGVLIAAFIYARVTSMEDPVLEGYDAPDFTLPSLGRGEMSLSAHRGKVVLVNIWATWCKPCLDEIPSLEALYKKTKGRGLEILAVSIDKGGARDVEGFVKKFGITFPVLLDPDGAVGRRYGITGVPETFIVNKKGAVGEKIVGPVEWNEEHALMMIEMLLAGEG